jgi:hypothetical protein
MFFWMMTAAALSINEWSKSFFVQEKKDDENGFFTSIGIGLTCVAGVCFMVGIGSLF